MGYCCCRVFGSYFSGEAVLILLLYLFPLFLLLIMIIFLLISHLLASMSGYRCRIHHRL